MMKRVDLILVIFRETREAPHRPSRMMMMMINFLMICFVFRELHYYCERSETRLIFFKVLQNLSISCNPSLSVGSIIIVPATGHDIVGA